MRRPWRRGADLYPQLFRKGGVSYALLPADELETFVLLVEYGVGLRRHGVAGRAAKLDHVEGDGERLYHERLLALFVALAKGVDAAAVERAWAGWDRSYPLKRGGVAFPMAEEVAGTLCWCLPLDELETLLRLVEAQSGAAPRTVPRLTAFGGREEAAYHERLTALLDHITARARPEIAARCWVRSELLKGS